MTPRPILGTDLQVSPVCLGTMTFGTPVGKAAAVRLTREAMDAGVNFLDTANMYEGYARTPGSPGGVAEEILGEALRGVRGKIVLATKVGNKVGEAPEDEGTSREAIRVQLDRSLKRLGTDYLDIYYLHRPDPATPLVESLSAMNEAIVSGKVRHYGLSNYSAEQTREVLRAADAHGLPRPVIHQPPFSLLKPQAGQKLLPLLEREGLAAAPYQVLQGGLLAGKYRRDSGVPDGSRMAEKPDWLVELTDEIFDRLEDLEGRAKQEGKSLLAYTIQHTLVRPAVVSVVVGVKRISQLLEIVAASD